MRLATLFPASAVALLGLALLAGCDAAPGSSADTGKLGEEVKELASRTKMLESTLETQRRQIAGLKDDIISLRQDQQELAAAGIDAVVAVAPGAAAAGEAPSGAFEAGTIEETADALARVLDTEAGQKAMDTHLQKANERRDAERWGRMTTMMVDRFAEMADLTDHQRVQVTEIFGKGTEELRGIWVGMRDQDASPEERAQRMEEARAKTEEVRAKMDDQMKGALSSSQYDQYKELSDRMGGGMMGGGGGRGGRGGGRGGF